MTTSNVRPLFVRLPAELYAKLQATATAEDRTLTAVVVRALANGLRPESKVA